MSDELKPCPFCGGAAEQTKHFRESIWRLIHRCPVVGPISFEWNDNKENQAAQWNRRSPAAQAETMTEREQPPALEPLNEDQIRNLAGVVKSGMKGYRIDAPMEYMSRFSRALTAVLQQKLMESRR